MQETSRTLRPRSPKPGAPRYAPPAKEVAWLVDEYPYRRSLGGACLQACWIGLMGWGVFISMCQSGKANLSPFEFWVFQACFAGMFAIPFAVGVVGTVARIRRNLREPGWGDHHSWMPG